MHRVGLIGLVLLVLRPGLAAVSEQPDTTIPVRIGWQIPAATQAQIAEVLRRTDVLESQGLEPRLVPFSYGTPQIEAALLGELDVIFAGDQPAIDLLMRGRRWKIVSRIFYDRIAIMVPPGSPAATVADLKGKTVASAFGSSGHREAILREEAAGLDPAADVRNRNMDILEIRRLVQSGGLASWGDVDAVTVWEPTASYFEREGLARSLSSGRSLGVVALSEDFISRHPEAAVQLLAGLVRAWGFLATNADRVRQWYVDDAQLGYTLAALEAATRVDPNFGARSVDEIDLSLSQADLTALERSAEWAREWGYAAGEFRVVDEVDTRLLARAMEVVRADHFERIEVVVPSAREVPDEGEAGSYLFDHMPVGAVYVLMVVVAFLGIEAGRHLGRWRRLRGDRNPDGPIGTVVAAVLGLLAFVIALTFSAAGDRFDARKEALLDEVNAIGTAYLRADLLPEPHRTTSRLLLRDYVETRLGMYQAYGHPESLRTVQARTSALQSALWSHARALATADRSSEIYALFTDALNTVFDLHTKRIVLGAEYRIPRFVWWSLWLVSALSMVAVGFQFGIGGHRSVTSSLALAMTFALVILLIFDLDRPGRGLIEVNQRPMLELYQSLSRQ